MVRGGDLIHVTARRATEPILAWRVQGRPFSPAHTRPEPLARLLSPRPLPTGAGAQIVSEPLTSGRREMISINGAGVPACQSHAIGMFGGSHSCPLP